MRAIENERKVLDSDVTSPDSPAAEVARNLFILADGMALPSDHSKLVKTDMLANAQRSHRLMAWAKAEQYRIAGTTATLELQRVAANILAHCRDAIQWGVSRSHPDIQKALDLAYCLRSEAVRQYALRIVPQKRSKVGEAEEAAQEVEEQLRDAQNFGCPYDMEQMDAARKLALKLREEEGLRKRQVYRSKTNESVTD
eukprot:CAMPEP_0171263876 /NCGR_PEP_ID=MMETSP0790-20130122/57324_1 /TAXON_ID=2925 /ORGANISM="Alexandrium catenella, Strain OF101" /LENGTH=197 /DNA_ID=CAMNT_0011732505 /DNA_START=9 /DNA_END=602 /DNA_ORIENTATION=-